MYTCTHCKKKFESISYISSNNKKYCSFECVPESGIDQPYSFQYFNLMDNINGIEEAIHDIVKRVDRLDLERELEELIAYYSLEIYGDDEGLFYKRQIGITLLTLDKLYDKIHNVFKDREINL